jgi:hypothetical protein
MISNNGKGFETFDFENLRSLQQHNFGAVESCQQSSRSGSVSTRSDVGFEHRVSDQEMGKLFSLIRFFSSLLIRKPATEHAEYDASAAVDLRPSVFCDVARCMVAAGYRSFKKTSVLPPRVKQSQTV